MFDALAGCRPQERTLEFFGLLSLPETSKEKPTPQVPTTAAAPISPILKKPKPR